MWDIAGYVKGLGITLTIVSLCQVRFVVGHTQSRRLLVVAIKLVSIVILGRMLRTFVTYE